MKTISKCAFNGSKSIAVFGKVGSGKTALVYSILTFFKDKQVYFFRHPRQELIEKMGFKNLDSLENMEKMSDCVIYIDEPQLHFGIYDRKSNAVIGRICSLARQLDITLVISSSDTRVFGKCNEAFFDTWILKDLDYDMVKNGSKIKKVIKKHTFIAPEGFQLDVNELIMENTNDSSLNGKYTFELPSEFTDEHSKAYKPVKTANEFSKQELLVQGVEK